MILAILASLILWPAYVAVFLVLAVEFLPGVSPWRDSPAPRGRGPHGPPYNPVVWWLADLGVGQ
jgi:hypothetical protein